ncbi:MAG TPA: NF038122 family metalloprotease [Blastocatellia bacterium]|nr:NF038122 family metalloprotease [Blastocatellia bacterium]
MRRVAELDDGRAEVPAVHEIGHVLGFDSNTGYSELVRNSPVAVSVWGLFRFRPGVSTDTFDTAQRILSSGGSQTFFEGNLTAQLSTGRPDGTGGDSQQASHWKDDRLTGIHIGVMDPTLSDGVRETITDSDLAVLRIVGFSIVTDGGVADGPTVRNISFNGKKLKVKGTGFSGQVELELNGLVVATAAELTISSNGKKLQIKSTQSALNIQSGSNQAYVISNGVRSNAFTFTF